MSLVGWLMLSEAEVPGGDDWLSREERRVQSGLHLEQRRGPWRLGRFTAKTALRRCPGSPLAGLAPEEISILPDAEGAPVVFRSGVRQPVALSLSHREGRALAVVGSPRARLGCDLEVVEPRSEAFVRDYFTAGERELVAGAPPGERARLANLVWSAKESALKALRTGLRVDTRTADVELGPDGTGEGWRPLRVRTNGRCLEGWWREDAGCLATVVALPA